MDKKTKKEEKEKKDSINLLDLKLKKGNREMEDLITTLSSLTGTLNTLTTDETSTATISKKEIHEKLTKLKLNEKAELLIKYLKEFQRLDCLIFRIAKKIDSP